MSTIRTARLEDLNSIMELELLCFPEDAFSRRLYRWLLQNCSCRIFLFEVQCELRGMIVLAWRRDSLVVHIHSIAVAPSCRGQGIAKILLREAIIFTRQLKRQRLVLEVNVGNTAAIGLYKKFGFDTIEILADYYGAARPAQRMALEISPEEE
jgi:ribosomal protein S18 acetylase RimI-like enzyme